jgi:hypothetical protein
MAEASTKGPDPSLSGCLVEGYGGLEVGWRGALKFGA